MTNNKRTFTMQNRSDENCIKYFEIRECYE